MGSEMCIRDRFRTGVSGYTEPSGRQIIEAKVGNHPAVIKDVSGWSGEDIGLLVEVMHCLTSAPMAQI